MKRIVATITIIFAACACDAPSRAALDGREGAAHPAIPAETRPADARPSNPASPATGGIPSESGPSTGDGTFTPPALTLRVLRVTSRAGGGDAILVADSAADPPRHVLIDAGDDGAAARALRALGVRSLDLLVLTHAHHDHYGGMDEVLDAVPVRAFAFGGQVRTAATYARLLDRIEREVPTVLVVDSIRRIRLGPGDDATTLTLLPPLPDHLAEDTDNGERLNDGSLAVRIERAGFSFLTTGDAERAANARFASAFAPFVDVDVFKVGHHGSTDATQPEWLDAVTPEVAIVSANGTTHPHARVLQLLEARGIPTYCTPQHGTVTIRVARDGRYTVHPEEGQGTRCRPGRSR